MNNTSINPSLNTHDLTMNTFGNMELLNGLNNSTSVNPSLNTQNLQVNTDSNMGLFNSMMSNQMMMMIIMPLISGGMTAFMAELKNVVIWLILMIEYISIFVIKYFSTINYVSVNVKDTQFIYSIDKLAKFSKSKIYSKLIDKYRTLNNKIYNITYDLPINEYKLIDNILNSTYIDEKTFEKNKQLLIDEGFEIKNIFIDYSSNPKINVIENKEDKSYVILKDIASLHP